jgi:hypothetical protein
VLKRKLVHVMIRLRETRRMIGCKHGVLEVSRRSWEVLNMSLVRPMVGSFADLSKRRSSGPWGC